MSCVDSSHQREPTLKIRTFSQPASFPFLKPDMQTECNNAWQYQAFHIEINLVEVYQSHSIMEIDQTRPEIDIPPWTGTGTPCRTTSGTISTSRRPATGELCRVSTGKTVLASIQYYLGLNTISFSAFSSLTEGYRLWPTALLPTLGLWWVRS